jgi:hypothetical protein
MECLPPRQRAHTSTTRTAQQPPMWAAVDCRLGQDLKALSGILGDMKGLARAQPSLPASSRPAFRDASMLSASTRVPRALLESPVTRVVLGSADRWRVA